ncbi:MAG: CofH family radical SAM protein [Candidatus Poseidoniaceae archaeon]|nr:CofH family radical SAM protein [Candidatus Poseidoniaceae archaeon]MDP7312489.1 CofH family radical SAM protein [Candidatus Thalassarchaeaceae archaeon]
MRIPGISKGWRAAQIELLESCKGLDTQLNGIRNRLIGEGRISAADGVTLLKHPNIHAIMEMAEACKQARFGSDVHFNVNLHVNQTNVCVLACRFCAFRRGVRSEDAYALDIEGYLSSIYPYSEFIDEVHSVGGLHPEWDVEHYKVLFNATRRRFPHICIKALTAVEIKHIATLSSLSIRDTLSELKEAGLDSIPGGGAEILVDSVRDTICKGKESSQEYLDIHKTAHELEIPSNCTMLFGTVESPEERIKHLIKLRELQDETSGFQCFVPYPFLPDSSRLPEAQLASGNEILRMISVSRLMLDNIPHIKAYRMNIGDALSELAIRCGADDIDGTVIQESIMHLAGSNAPLRHDVDELCRLIERAGCAAVKRDTIYSNFERLESTKSSSQTLVMVK